MEILILSIGIVTIIFGIFIGLFIGQNVNIHDEECCMYNYDMFFRCKKLFITNHYNTLKDYDIVDLSEYIKNGIIRVDCGRTRPAESGEAHGRTNLYEPAAIRKKKGEEKWEYVKL